MEDLELIKKGLENLSDTIQEIGVDIGSSETKIDNLRILSERLDRAKAALDIYILAYRFAEEK